jgi:outer membrane murein-binding lipoprotein Lpp
MRRTIIISFCLSCCLLSGESSADSHSDDAIADQIQSVLDENARLRSRLDALEAEVRSARDEAAAARALAGQSAGGTAPASVDAGPGGPSGGASVQLLDMSVDVLSSVGGSSVEDETLENLQGGGHDPRQRGFNLQNLELSLLGAVDPYFDGEAHLIYFIDAEGESQFEVEEAFATTRMLPFGLEGRGLQLEVGQMFTEFGRINPQHPHAWDWQDQPVVLTRFFGEDGMRGLGARLGWLLPVPWFSELHPTARRCRASTPATSCSRNARWPAARSTAQAREALRISCTCCAG